MGRLRKQKGAIQIPPLSKILEMTFSRLRQPLNRLFLCFLPYPLFDGREHRVDDMERRFDGREHRIDDMERHFDGREHHVDDTERRFDGREHRMRHDYPPLSIKRQKKVLI